MKETIAVRKRTQERTATGGFAEGRADTVYTGWADVLSEGYGQMLRGEVPDLGDAVCFLNPHDRHLDMDEMEGGMEVFTSSWRFSVLRVDPLSHSLILKREAKTEATVLEDSGGTVITDSEGNSIVLTD